MNHPKRDWQSGLWRGVGHFLVYATGPNIISGIAEWQGVSIGWFSPPISGPLFLLTVVIVFILEMRDLAKGRQTLAKTPLDLLTKIGGAAVGFATWTFWWR